MRLMLDTNVFLYYATEHEALSSDVKELLLDYDNILTMSIESVRELVIAYKVKKSLQKLWKSAEEMVISIQTDYNIHIIPFDMNVMRTFSKLNAKQDHKDPSDHVIISHAITLDIPLISSDRKFPYYQEQGLQLIENVRP